MSINYMAALVVGLPWNEIKDHLSENHGVGDSSEVEELGLECFSAYLDDDTPIVGVKLMQTSPYSSLEVRNNLVEPCSQAVNTFSEKVGLKGKLFLTTVCF